MKKLTLLLTLSLSVVTALQAMDTGADLDPGWSSARQDSSIQQPSSQEFDWRDFFNDPIKDQENDLCTEMLPYQDPFFGDPAGPGAGAAPASCNSGTNSMTMPVAACTNSSIRMTDNTAETRKRRHGANGIQRIKRGRTDRSLDADKLYSSLAALEDNQAGLAAAVPIDFTSTASTATTVSVEPVVAESQVTPIPQTLALTPCPQCKCISNLSRPMRTHISKCNPKKNEKYKHVCNWDPKLCTMRFFSSADLTDHMNSHAGEYKCCYCKKDMQSNRKLQDHKKTCEKNSKKRVRMADTRTEEGKRKPGAGRNDVHEGVTENGTQETKRGRTDGSQDAAERDDSFVALSRDPTGHTTAPATRVAVVSVLPAATTTVTAQALKHKNKKGSGRRRVTDPILDEELDNALLPLAEEFAPERAVERSEESQVVALMPPAPAVRQYLQSVSECSLCNCISNLDRAMAIHISKCNPGEIRKYVCNWNRDLCTMPFKSFAHRRDHMNSHTGEYKCCYCKKEMHNTRNLKDHKKICKKVRMADNRTEKRKRELDALGDKTEQKNEKLLEFLANLG